MDRATFAQLQAETIQRYTRILASASPGEFDEAALPAYTNPNPLMRWVFWRRIWIVVRLLESLGPIRKALDFGCGLGTMLPVLLSRAEHVTGVDLEIAPVVQVAASENWQRVRFETALTPLLAHERGSFDLVLALDVLEHVQDLRKTLSEFAALLTPGGVLIISAPTENLLYKLGRRLAGYSGHYHCRNASAILREAAEQFAITPESVLLPFAPLFVIASGRLQTP